MYAVAFTWLLGVSAALGQTAESKFSCVNLYLGNYTECINTDLE